MFAPAAPFSRGGTVPTNLLVLSPPLDVVELLEVLLFSIRDNFSFFKLVVPLLPLFEGADADPPNRVLDVEEDVPLPLPILFGRLEFDVVSENESVLEPTLLLEPPL